MAAAVPVVRVVAGIWVWWGRPVSPQAAWFGLDSDSGIRQGILYGNWGDVAVAVGTDDEPHQLHCNLVNAYGT